MGASGDGGRRITGAKTCRSRSPATSVWLAMAKAIRAIAATPPQPPSHNKRFEFAAVPAGVARIGFRRHLFRRHSPLDSRIIENISRIRETGAFFRASSGITGGLLPTGRLGYGMRRTSRKAEPSCGCLDEHALRSCLRPAKAPACARACRRRCMRSGGVRCLRM